MPDSRRRSTETSRRDGATHRNGRAKPPAAPAPDANGASPDAGARRRRASTRRADLNAELVQELRALRAELREMMGRYDLRVGGQLAELAQRVDGDPSIGVPPRPLPARTAEAMLERVRARRIKPRKGRAKDFVRLEELVERLVDDAPEA